MNLLLFLDWELYKIANKKIQYSEISYELNYYLGWISLRALSEV